jgi:alanyl-tRNA synthetase
VVVARPTEGTVVQGQRAKAMVNAVRRHQTACNHTATHLLHNALRLIVGEEARQAGSYVSPERLRFDFTIRSRPTDEQLRQVEELVNRRIVENHPVRPFVTTREFAKEVGAIAFFEEKYGEFVRVLEIDDFSRELCGGTHVSSTSQIGVFKLTASQSIGANTRRLEAVTSARAIEHYRGLEAAYEGLAETLRVKAERVPVAVERLHERVAELERELAAAQSGESRSRLDDLLQTARDAGGVPVLGAAPPGMAKADDLLALVDAARERHPDAVVVLAAAIEGRAALLVAVGDGAVGRGLKANDVLQAMLPHVEGRGGGRPTLARGSGPRVDGAEAAVAAGLAQVAAILGA